MKKNSQTKRRQCKRCGTMTANGARVPFCGPCLVTATVECDEIRALHQGRADVRAGRLVAHADIKREFA